MSELEWTLWLIGTVLVACYLLADSQRDIDRQLENDRIRRASDSLQEALDAAAKARELQVRK